VTGWRSFVRSSKVGEAAAAVEDTAEVTMMADTAAAALVEATTTSKCEFETLRTVEICLYADGDLVF